MARSWRFELGRARATARLSFDFLRSVLQPVREGTVPDSHRDAPLVTTDLGTGAVGPLPASLRLVSWNVHRGYDVRGVAAGLRSLMTNCDPHLLLLQEVPVYPRGPWWLEPGVGELLEGLHLVFASMHRVARPTTYYPFLESGLLIGARAQPVCRRALRLPVASHPKLGRNHSIERIALAVRCPAAALRPEIFNVHLENTARPAGRARQAAALAAALDDGPVIIGGDVNTMFGPLEGVASALEAAGVVRVPLRGQRRWSPSIDHIFVRGAAQAAGEVLRVSGSDHFPVFAEVELADAPPDAD